MFGLYYNPGPYGVIMDIFKFLQQNARKIAGNAVVAVLPDFIILYPGGIFRMVFKTVKYPISAAFVFFLHQLNDLFIGVFLKSRIISGNLAGCFAEASKCKWLVIKQKA
jgi:hypothetical protein